MGSKVGWIISAVLVLLFVIGVVIPVTFPSPSKPVKALETGFVGLYKISEPISRAVGTIPSGAGNAGDDYIEAVRVYRDNKEEVDNFITASTAPPMPAVLPESVQQIISHVEQGAEKAKMKYVFVHTPKELSVKRFYDPADELNTIANAVLYASHFHANRDERDRQIDLLKALCIFGWHLFEERGNTILMSYGLGFQMDAANFLGLEYKKMGLDEDRNNAEAYYTAVTALSGKFDEKMSVLWNTKPAPGEIFYVAENDADRAWKVRAVLTLGVLKFTSTGSDRRYNKKLITRLMTDSDPMVAAAAKAARTLMMSEFNMLAADLR